MKFKLFLVMATVVFSSFAQAQFYNPGPGSGSVNSPRGEQEVRRLVRMLYAGILFREVDWDGADYFADKVRYQGYAGVIEAASDMAYSDEFYSSVLPRY